MMNAPANAAASASVIQSLSAQLDSANTDKGSALTAISQANEEAAPKVKEIALWDGEMQKMKPQIDYVVEKRNKHNGDAAAVNQKVAVHNAGCNGTLPKPQFERCKGEEPYLQSQINRINAAKAQIDSEANGLRGRIQNIETRRSSLASQVQQIKARQDDAFNRLHQAEQRIAALTLRLRQACNEGPSPEALAYCGQVDWDGARKGLTAPNLQPHPFGATAN
jgi:chromosome segregation ATPase